MSRSMKRLRSDTIQVCSRCQATIQSCVQIARALPRGLCRGNGLGGEQPVQLNLAPRRQVAAVLDPPCAHYTTMLWAC